MGYFQRTMCPARTTLASSHRADVLRQRLACALVSIVWTAGVFSASANAANYTWSGATDTLWATTTNWLSSAGGVPTTSDSVVFQGVRKEDEYREEPGQWDRVWINQGSLGNKINYAVIKNGNIGIQAENLIELGEAGPSRLTLSNTRIRNMKAFGIYGVNYQIEAWNNVVSNCGAYTLALIRGGNYTFRHCTFANYWSENVRSEPSVLLSNAQTRPDNSVVIAPMDFSFLNGIVYGNLQSGNELIVDGLPDAPFNWVFKNSVLKIDNPDINTDDPLHFVAMKLNQDPEFVDVNAQNYKLSASSVARNWGNISFVNIPPVASEDIEGVSRIADEAPDAGAYEFVP